MLQHFRTIRKTCEADIPNVLMMYEHSRKIMRSNGNFTQWTNGYPNEDALRKDIAKGVSYVIEEERIAIGTFAFIVGVEPTYEYITEGQWPDTPDNYGTIHRIACREGVHDIMRSCLDWCFTQQNCIRIDTHSDNAIMLHILEKEQFQYCGIIFVADGTPRKAFQKRLKSEQKSV